MGKSVCVQLVGRMQLDVSGRCEPLGTAMYGRCIPPFEVAITSQNSFRRDPHC